MITPNAYKSLTDTQLWEASEQFIAKTYNEVQHYDFVIEEDILTTGINRFRMKSIQCREWGNRVLAMASDATRILSAVRPMAMGKAQLRDSKLVDWLRTHRQDESVLPKGLDAKERAAVSKLENPSYIEDADKWESLQSEFRELLSVLHDKYKNLIAAREDFRNLLWAVRLQGVLGEGFGKSDLERELGPEINLLKNTIPFNGEPQYSQNGAETGLKDDVGAPDPDIDALLKV